MTRINDEDLELAIKVVEKLRISPQLRNFILEALRGRLTGGGLEMQTIDVSVADLLTVELAAAGALRSNRREVARLLLASIAPFDPDAVSCIPPSHLLN